MQLYLRTKELVEKVHFRLNGLQLAMLRTQGEVAFSTACVVLRGVLLTYVSYCAFLLSYTYSFAMEGNYGTYQSLFLFFF